MPLRSWIPLFAVVVVALLGASPSRAFHPHPPHPYSHHQTVTTTTAFVNTLPANVHIGGVSQLSAPLFLSAPAQVYTTSAPFFNTGVTTLSAPFFNPGVTTLSSPFFNSGVTTLSAPFFNMGVTTLSAPETVISTSKHVAGNTEYTIQRTTSGRDIITSAPVTGNSVPPGGGEPAPAPKTTPSSTDQKLDKIIADIKAMQADVTAIKNNAAPKTDQLKDILDAVNSMKTDINSMKSDITGLKKDVGDLKKK